MDMFRLKVIQLCNKLDLAGCSDMTDDEIYNLLSAYSNDRKVIDAAMNEIRLANLEDKNAQKEESG